MAVLLRTWPALAAWGAGLVHVAIGAGADAAAAAALVAVGCIELAWGIAAMREGRVVAPRATLGTGLGVLVAGGAWALSPAGAGLPLLALAAASVFVLFIAGAAAVAVRGRRPGADAPAEQPRRARAALGLVLGAVLVAGVATPALAATEAGQLARPHGDHGVVVPDLPESPGHQH